jgi:signal transduction histidine kinase
MDPLFSLPRSLVFAAYVLTFAGTAIACFAGLTRTGEIDDEDTRRGLVSLLLTSGAWAAVHVGFLVAPSVDLKLVFYYLGLILGIAAVGPWLYFCSAYTGRRLHRDTQIRRAAVGLFLAVSLVKLTNPIHQLYFRAELLTAPFPHLAIHSQELHWLVMGLAYALAIVGYFMLFELFWQVGHDTRPLMALVAITGLPLLLDVLGIMLPQFLSITYEPLGVAAFAIGVLFVFLEDFQRVKLAGEHDSPVVILTEANTVRDYNTEARELFPRLETGQPVDVALPELATSLDEADPEPIVEIARSGETRYYQLAVQPFSTDRTRNGQAISLTDVTDRERYRQEMKRQNDRLDQFASMVSHDLRNPLNVAQGRVDLEREESESAHLDAAARSLARMEALIDDVLALARQGQPIDETEPVALSTVAEAGWEVVDTQSATLAVDGDGTMLADASRLQQLLENLYRNAIEHGGEDVTVRVGVLDADGFFLEDDGPGVPPDERAEVFESGYSTAAEGTGFGLAIVREIATAHGWESTLTEGESGGARFEMTGVRFLA